MSRAHKGLSSLGLHRNSFLICKSEYDAMKRIWWISVSQTWSKWQWAILQWCSASTLFDDYYWNLIHGYCHSNFNPFTWNCKWYLHLCKTFICVTKLGNLIMWQSKPMSETKYYYDRCRQFHIVRRKICKQKAIDKQQILNRCHLNASQLNLMPNIVWNMLLHLASLVVLLKKGRSVHIFFRFCSCRWMIIV